MNVRIQQRISQRFCGEVADTSGCARSHAMSAGAQGRGPASQPGISLSPTRGMGQGNMIFVQLDLLPFSIRLQALQHDFGGPESSPERGIG